MYDTPEYKYKGFTYKCWLDIEPNENCKIFHEIYNSQGQEISYDLGFERSPYDDMSKDEFEYIIDYFLKYSKFPISWDREELNWYYKRLA